MKNRFMNWAVAATLTFSGLSLSAAGGVTVSLLYTYDGSEFKTDGRSAKAAFVVTTLGGASEFQVAGVDGTEIGAWNGKNQVFLVNGLAVSTEFTSCTVDGEVVDLVAPFKTTAAMATRSVSGKVYQSTTSKGPAWWVSPDGKTMDYLPVDGGGADRQVTASRAGWSVFADGDCDVFAWPETVMCNSRRYIVFHYAVRAKDKANAPCVAKCAIGAKLQLYGNLNAKAGLSGYGWLVQQAGGLTPYMNLGLFTRKGHGGVMEKIDRQPSAMWFGAVETGKTLADHAFDNTPDPAGIGKLNPGHVAVSWQDLDLSSGDVQTMSVAFGNFDAEVMEEDAGDLFVTYTAEGWEGTYDGLPHGISVTPLEPADAKMQYALAKEGPYRDAPYTFTNVNETATDVWFRLDAEGYAAVTNSAKVKISPCAVKLTSGSQSWPYDGAAHSNMTVEVEGAFAAGEGVKTNDFATITDVGVKPNSFDYELVLKPGSIAENYLVACVTGTLTVASVANAWLVEPTVTDKEYDGTPAAVTMGQPKFGTVSVTYDDGQTEAPVGAGDHMAKFTVAATENYGALEKVVSYAVGKAVVNEPLIVSKIYNDQPQTADVADSDNYVVVRNNGGTMAGRYAVVLKLVDAANCRWASSGDETIVLPFEITSDENAWTSGPTAPTSVIGSGATFPVATAKYGDVEVRYSGTAVDGTVVENALQIVRPGTYTAKFKARTTSSWFELTARVQLTVSAAGDVSAGALKAISAAPVSVSGVKLKSMGIPRTWFSKYQDFSAKFGNDLSKAVLMKTGKLDGNGNEMQVWQDYIAGTDPTKGDSRLSAKIEFRNGRPKISWTPNQNTNGGRVGERVYTVWGKKSLADKEWTPNVDETTGEWNFFKVTVDMPEQE